MKKGVLLGIGAFAGLVLVVGVVAGLVGGGGSRTTYTPEWGVRAATAVVDARRGYDGVPGLTADPSSPVTPAFVTGLADYVASLKAVDDRKIDIGYYYETNFVKESTEELDEMDDPGAADDFDANLDKFDPGKATIDADFKQDERIKNDGTMDYMYVKDFDYSNGKYDIVPYKDANMLIPKGEYPTKYADLAKDSRNYYTFDSYKDVDKDTLDVLFVPVDPEGTNIIIRITHTSEEITGFGVIE